MVDLMTIDYWDGK